MLSKYCTECTAAVLSGDSPDFAIWYKGRKSECQINHTGSTSRMEMEAVVILLQRSIKECNVCYTSIWSDGDSKTFQHLMSLNIYGKVFFKRALANEESPERHSIMKTKLTEKVVAKILPVYHRLASNEILSRCISGNSQNGNESLYSVIWSHCPKESIQSKKRVEISLVTAVCEFNFGSLFTLKHVHQNASLPLMQISGVRDDRRLKQSRNKTFQIAKDKRTKKRKISNKIENKNIKSEGLS
ncbi:uncharacterized protein TNCV_1412221 [Trichonephila clavipes]|nr:uncharacterized protein TNCV_1412221 [Trichonephila clavipes]